MSLPGTMYFGEQNFRTSRVSFVFRASALVVGALGGGFSFSMLWQIDAFTGFTF